MSKWKRVGIEAHYLMGTPMQHTQQIEVTKADYLDGLGGAERVDLSQLDFQQWIQSKVYEIAGTPVTVLVEGRFYTYFPTAVTHEVLEVEPEIITS